MLIAVRAAGVNPVNWKRRAGYRPPGARLVLAVAAGIRARGEIPFLHAMASNANAIRLYESLGFSLRRMTSFNALRVPEDEVISASRTRA